MACGCLLSRKMLPSGSAPDAVDCPIGELHLFGNSRRTKSFFPERDDFHSSVFTYGSIRVLLTPAEISPALGNAISKVVSMIAKEQVFWVDARAVITFVQNQKAIGDFTTVYPPGNSVCEIRFPKSGENHYVSVGVFASRFEFPARA